jgi:enoyl-[acyl-carrier protein] reductase II
MWRTAITRQLNVDLPFVGAGMAIIGGPELTAAVSEAGGIGLFCLGPGAPSALGEAIDDIRRRTRRPFGVDFIVEDTAFGPATTDAHIAVAVEKRVPLCVFFWNPPKPHWIETLRAAGAKLWGTAYSVDGALQLKALGMDAVILQSSEAGGHTRAQDSAFVLLPAVVEALERTPVIAAGGVVDGSAAAAAFALGAEGVCVGTRLLASAESQASDEYKARLLAAGESATAVTAIFGPEWPGAPMRVLRNGAVVRAERGEPPPDAAIGETLVFGQPYVMPAHSAILPTTRTRGDHEEMCLAAGAGVGRVHSIQSARDIVADIMRDARARIERLAKLSR